MIPGDTVVMQHPDGFATVSDGGGRFVGWIPNGIQGVIYVLTPSSDRAVVHFDGRLIATVSVTELSLVKMAAAPAA